MQCLFENGNARRLLLRKRPGSASSSFWHCSSRSPGNTGSLGGAFVRHLAVQKRQTSVANPEASVKTIKSQSNQRMKRWEFFYTGVNTFRNWCYLYIISFRWGRAHTPPITRTSVFLRAHVHNLSHYYITQIPRYWADSGLHINQL